MLSFIITTYRRPQMLQRLLESLHYQTDQDFYTVIVDDNSQDATEAIARSFLELHGGEYYTTDVTEAQRSQFCRYAVNINHILGEVGLFGDAYMTLCDDVNVTVGLVEVVNHHLAAHPEQGAGFVSELWVNPDGSSNKTLWYDTPQQIAFCRLDHSQVVTRVEHMVPWPVHPLAWPFADGIAFERLLGKVGALYPIGTAQPLVHNFITDTSVCRQPVAQALEKLQHGI